MTNLAIVNVLPFTPLILLAFVFFVVLPQMVRGADEPLRWPRWPWFAAALIPTAFVILACNEVMS